MKKKFICVIMTVLLLTVFTACTPTSPAEKTVRDDGVTTSKKTANSTTLVEETTTTTVTEVVTTTATTAVVSTTTTKTLPSKKSTATSTTSTAPTTKGTIPRYKLVEPKEPLTFSYDSEDYTVLKKYIAKHFPEEKCLSEFRVQTLDGTEYKCPGGFRVLFTRWINGCMTDSYYNFSFDTYGELFEIRYRSFEYDASKVKPPRVATEAEIEAAKQIEVEMIPDGMVLWAIEPVYSFYSIYQDRNYFRVSTVYVDQETYDLYSDETSQYYGMGPPCQSNSKEYIIPR